MIISEQTWHVRLYRRAYIEDRGWLDAVTTSFHQLPGVAEARQRCEQTERFYGFASNEAIEALRQYNQLIEWRTQEESTRRSTAVRDRLESGRLSLCPYFWSVVAAVFVYTLAVRPTRWFFQGLSTQVSQHAGAIGKSVLAMLVFVVAYTSATYAYFNAVGDAAKLANGVVAAVTDPGFWDVMSVLVGVPVFAIMAIIAIFVSVSRFWKQTLLLLSFSAGFMGKPALLYGWEAFAVWSANVPERVAAAPSVTVTAFETWLVQREMEAQAAQQRDVWAAEQEQARILKEEANRAYLEASRRYDEQWALKYPKQAAARKAQEQAEFWRDMREGSFQMACLVFGTVALLGVGYLVIISCNKIGEAFKEGGMMERNFARAWTFLAEGWELTWAYTNAKKERFCPFLKLAD